MIRNQHAMRRLHSELNKDDWKPDWLILADHIICNAMIASHRVIIIYCVLRENCICKNIV